MGDEWGLGDFAVFLGDDPLPVRPSQAAEAAELAEDYDYMNPKKSSPTKETPAWKFGKVKYPRISRQRQEGMEDLDSIKLPCDNCECKECKRTYRSYWEEKSFSRELNRALEEERKAMDETLIEIAKMEADYKDRISQLRLEIDVVNEKNRVSEENLEFERKLRADETYRREMVDEETKNLHSSQISLEKKVFAYNEEVIRLRRENEALKNAVESSHQLREKSLQKVNDSVVIIDALERDNAEFKTALFQAEIECNKLKLSRDNLKQRLNQVTDFWGKPIAPPTGFSSSMAGSASRAGTAHNQSVTLASVAQEMRNNKPSLAKGTSTSSISRGGDLGPVRTRATKKKGSGGLNLAGASISSISTLGGEYY